MKVPLITASLLCLFLTGCSRTTPRQALDKHLDFEKTEDCVRSTFSGGKIYESQVEKYGVTVEDFTTSQSSAISHTAVIRAYYTLPLDAPENFYGRGTLVVSFPVFHKDGVWHYIEEGTAFQPDALYNFSPPVFVLEDNFTKSVITNVATALKFTK